MRVMAPKKSGKKRNKATPRQMKLIEERAKGKSYSEAAIAAGYSERTHASLAIKRCSNYAAAFPICSTDTA